MKHHFRWLFGVRLLTLMAALGAIAGCASTRALQVAAVNAAVVDRSLDGTLVLRSEKKHTVVVRPIAPRFSSELRALPSFAVMVTNGGTQAVAFGPDNVLAASDGASVTLITAAATKQRMLEEMNASRRGMIGVRDATQSGEPVYRYPENGTERLQVATMAGRDPSDPVQRDLNLPTTPVPSRLLSEALTPQTIRPGSVGGGYVTLEAREIATGAPLRISVNVAGETHTFLFEVRD